MSLLRLAIRNTFVAHRKPFLPTEAYSACGRLSFRRKKWACRWKNDLVLRALPPCPGFASTTRGLLRLNDQASPRPMGLSLLLSNAPAS